MPRHRKNDNFEALAYPLAVFVFFFGAAVIAFLKTILLIASILACAAAVVAIAVYAGRVVWKRRTDIESFLPNINWEVPLPAIQIGPCTHHLWFDNYPSFPHSHWHVPPHVIGTSGAWK